jgi:hypothetical protein
MTIKFMVVLGKMDTTKFWKANYLATTSKLDTSRKYFCNVIVEHV